MNGKNAKWINERKKLIINLAVLLLFILLVSVVIAPPSPHNIDGQVFVDNSQTTGVPANTPVLLNDTISGDLVMVYTEDPGPPPLRGIYSATISGSDGDLIIATAWNSTHFGMSNATLLSTTTTLIIVLNRTRPSEANVTIISPQNNSVRNTTNLFNLTANISILGSDAANCNATLILSSDDANITLDQNFTNKLGDINVNSHKVTTWNITGKKHGPINTTVFAQCSSDSINIEKVSAYTIYLFINDTTRPIVNLASPINNGWVMPNITFVYNATENTGLKNCSLYFDGRFNQSSILPLSGTIQNFTVNATPEGRHNWSVTCYDASSNEWESNSTHWFLGVDGTPPNITLLAPLNNSALDNYSVSFSYNVTDNHNATNCTLVLNDMAVRTNTTILQNKTNYFNLSIEGKDYNWSINCTDTAGNTGSSGIFLLLTPDLKVNFSDIIFSASTFVESEIIEINATIFNVGSANQTRNATVRFYESSRLANFEQIGRNFSVNVTSGGNATLGINYTTKVGITNIFVLADIPLATNGSVVESNETNNNASRQIFISSYHIYYGSILADIVLDTSNNSSITAWFNISSFSGNIFAADSDSSLGFTSLRAIGLNLSNNITMGDFEELDIALNMTNLSDSINLSYTFNNLTKAKSNFTAFNTAILNVPAVNSTNNSYFITGIVWDTSDENKGEFNGSQDIAFITKVSRNSVGSYGSYDYEIRVPSGLEKYIVPDALDSITFYREIT